MLVVVFLELGFFFEKQFLEHPTPLKISRDLEQCPVVLKPIGTAPAEVDLELSVAEGEYHALVFPC